MFLPMTLPSRLRRIFKPRSLRGQGSAQGAASPATIEGGRIRREEKRPMRVEDFLRDSARRLPGKTALVAGKRRLSFAELDVMSDRLAAALADRGIGRGDRVVVFMENSFEALVAILAVLKAGAAFSPINPSTKSDELAFILDNGAAAGIITQARLAGTAGAAMARAGSVQLVVLGGAGGAPAATS